MSEQYVNNADELKALSRGTILVSPNWAEAFSFIGGVGSPWKLLNCTTRQYTSPAEIGNFFPARIIYQFGWSK